MNFKEWIYNEAFDTITDFLLNPEHREKRFDQLEKEFEAAGGKILGHGSHATVYSHPSWPYVVKVYAHDPVYTRFVRFAYQQNHPVFPKFYGLPQKVVPEFTRTRQQTYLYLVRMEVLHPIPQDAAKRILDDLDGVVHYLQYPPTPEQRADKYAARTYDRYDALLSDPHIRKFYEGCIELLKFKGGALDHATSNIMQRSNGDLVFADPFWEGSNPYADAMRAREMEIGYDDYTEPEMFKGGKIPTSTRRRPRNQKPFKPPVYSGSDEIPF